MDFLTTAKTPRDTRPREIPAFGIAARPLRYMDYVVREDVDRGLFIGPHAVLVNIPHPGRFALHKLAVASRRRGGESIKSDKDRRQASALILALADVRPGALVAAVTAARKHHDRGLVKAIETSLDRLSADARAALRW